MRRTQMPIPVCDSGKVAFTSRGAADRALRRISVTNAQAAVPTSAPQCAYKCKCGAWHLTSRPERVR